MRIVYNKCILGGDMCSAVMYPDFGESVKLVLSLVGKCAVTGSFSVIYLFSAELFPTEVRYIMGSTRHVWCILCSLKKTNL